MVRLVFCSCEEFCFCRATFPPFDDAVDEDLCFCFFLYVVLPPTVAASLSGKGGSKQSLSKVSQLGWSSEKFS